MLLFSPDSRVKKTLQGIEFYEQDLLFSDYSFNEDIEIDIKLDYVSPGFGVCIMQDNGLGLNDVANSVLLKLGVNDFRVYSKKYSTTTLLTTDSNLYEPTKINSDLVFKITSRKLELFEVEYGPNGDKVLTSLGSYKLPKTYEHYKIGFYSAANNVLKNVEFKQLVPKYWRVSTKNARGGRVSFKKHQIKFENSEKYSEFEQRTIPLKKGIYFLRYETEPVDGICDVKPYVFPAHIKNLDNEKELENDEKNLLDKNNSFTLKEDGEVNLKFIAHSGIVKNISILDNPKSSYVETYDEQVHQDGSEIRINLKGLKKVEWEAKIIDTPDWVDFSKKCPYAVVASTDHRFTLEDLMLNRNQIYKYELEVSTMRLTIFEENPPIQHGKPIPHIVKVINLLPQDNNIITILQNMNVIVYKLVVTETNGASVDIIHHMSYKKFVPGTVHSPIIVQGEPSKEEYDLSSSFRQVIRGEKALRAFNKEIIFQFRTKVPQSAAQLKLYGIPLGVQLDRTKTKIEEYAPQYNLLQENTDWSKKSHGVEVKDHVWDVYPTVVVETLNVDNFDYEFTNYEREVFDGALTVLNLEGQLADKNQTVILYGIPKGTEVYPDYLYRVTSKAAMTQIDCYTEEYELVPLADFVINTSANEIQLKQSLKEKYDSYVVDYLKRNSYSINWRQALLQNELDVTTEEDKFLVHYDEHEGGTSYEFKRTDIVPNEDKYIVLEPKG